MFAAEFEPAGQRRRREPRAPSALDAELGIAGIGRALCRFLDFSTRGARVQTYSELQRGTMIWLALPGVVWARDYEVGIEFRTPLSAKAMEALAAR
ncbi:PilZ domain-containing protein [Sphingomonas sp. dw_22]|uniref:PilZ domain-containing protein n=1 Tax=Sphingomonas sp. dw_22 TaxID=2721175 RepID=UPI001BD4FA2A|nr:PilZ domain-containing protein [Sphingomonas sp. dw_22]